MSGHEKNGGSRDKPLDQRLEDLSRRLEILYPLIRAGFDEIKSEDIKRFVHIVALPQVLQIAGRIKDAVADMRGGEK